MDISPISVRSLGSNYSFKSNYENNQPKTITNPIEADASALDALAAYNSPLVREFEESSELDIDDENLFPAGSIKDSYELEELRSKHTNTSSLSQCLGSLGELQRKRLNNAGLTKEEIADKVQNYYEAIKNNEGILPEEDKYEELSDEANRALETLARAKYEIQKTAPATNKEICLYRKIDNYDEYANWLKALEPDEETTISTNAMYCGYSIKDVIDTYGSNSNQVILKIKMPKGSKLPFGCMSIEEAYIEPCAKFRVVGNEKYKNDNTLITLEYIKPEEE